MVRVQTLADITKKVAQEHKRPTDMVPVRHKDTPIGTGKPVHTPTTGLGS
jgi:hypothetical protein